jgi:hypothetical protein
MSLKKTVLLSATGWVVLISALHAGLNLQLFRHSEAAQKQLKVGFIPVT